MRGVQPPRLGIDFVAREGATGRDTRKCRSGARRRRRSRARAAAGRSDSRGSAPTHGSCAPAKGPRHEAPRRARLSGRTCPDCRSSTGPCPQSPRRRTERASRGRWTCSEASARWCSHRNRTRSSCRRPPRGTHPSTPSGWHRFLCVAGRAHRRRPRSRHRLCSEGRRVLRAGMSRSGCWSKAVTGDWAFSPTPSARRRTVETVSGVSETHVKLQDSPPPVCSVAS